MPALNPRRQMLIRALKRTSELTYYVQVITIQLKYDTMYFYSCSPSVSVLLRSYRIVYYVFNDLYQNQVLCEGKDH